MSLVEVKVFTAVGEKNFDDDHRMIYNEIRKLNNVQEMIHSYQSYFNLYSSKTLKMLRLLATKASLTTKLAFKNWRDYNNKCMIDEVFHSLRSARLLSAVSRISIRTMRQAHFSIISVQDKTKILILAIKKICSTMQRMPKIALEKWGKYVIACKNKGFLDDLRSVKLLNCLTGIPIRTTRNASQTILGGGNAIKGKL